MGSMSTDEQVVKPRAPIQIGVILCTDIAEQALPALKFLLLQLNTLQRAFEYQWGGNGVASKHLTFELAEKSTTGKVAEKQNEVSFLEALTTAFDCNQHCATSSR